MKQVILIFILLISGSHYIYSQNAFSDAISISKNSQDYIKTINRILSVADISLRQESDLKNLRQFLEYPWDDTLRPLNFKIVLEISKIILGLGESERKIRSDTANLTREIKNLKDESDKLKEELEITELELSEPNLSPEDSSRLTAKKEELEGAKRDAETKRENKIADLEKKNKLLETISDLRARQPGETYEEFRTELQNENNPITLLGKDNDEEVKQTVSNSNFSLSQAAIIEAVGNAIVEQVKEGLVNSLFEGILDKDFELSAEAGTTTLKDELRIFFPKTIKILENLKESRSNNYFTNLNITLKNTFTEDLKNMLENITNDENMKYSKIFRRYFYNNDGSKNDAYNYLTLSLALINNVKNGFHPIELIPVFENILAQSTSENFRKYAEYISMIDLLQKNLRDVSQNSGNIWISLTNLDNLSSAPVPGSKTSAEYFMAILYQSNRDRFKYIKELFAPLSGFSDSSFDLFKNNLSSFIIIIRSIEKNVNELTKGNAKSFNDYVQYLDNFTSLLDTANYLMSNYFFKTGSEIFKTYISDFRIYTGYSMQIYKSITNGSYSKILPVALEMFTKQFKYAADSTGFKNEIIRYTNLYVDVSTATTQSELNSAISKAAHNSGGYLRKSEESFNISVDSYPGIFLSSENINDQDGKFNFGFSVPLGFNFQFKQIGIFLQAFELAAAVNYRFSDDSTTNLPSDVTFQQVFSPGAFFVINPFRTIPLSVNLGISVTPALREISGSGVTLDDSKSTFYGVNFAYNVPLWYLY